LRRSPEEVQFCCRWLCATSLPRRTLYAHAHGKRKDTLFVIAFPRYLVDYYVCAGIRDAPRWWYMSSLYVTILRCVPRGMQSRSPGLRVLSRIVLYTLSAWCDLVLTSLPPATCLNALRRRHPAYAPHGWDITTCATPHRSYHLLHLPHGENRRVYRFVLRVRGVGMVARRWRPRMLRSAWLARTAHAGGRILAFGGAVFSADCAAALLLRYLRHLTAPASLLEMKNEHCRAFCDPSNKTTTGNAIFARHLRLRAATLPLRAWL